MQAFRWAFEIYRSDLGKVALPVVVVETVVLLVAMVLPRLFASALRGALGIVPTAGPDSVTYVQYLVSGLLGMVACAYAVSALYPYLLNLARGRPVELSEAFRPAPQFPAAILLVGVQMVAITLGTSLCALPGMAAVVLSTTALPALFDRDLEALAALKQSVEHTQANLGSMLFFGLLSIALTLVGVALCAVGAILVSLPIVMLAQIHVYLRLNGEIPIGVEST